jgi:hypothetical protein
MFVMSCLAIVAYAASQALIVATYPGWITVVDELPVEHAALWAFALALPTAFLVGHSQRGAGVQLAG